jgi:hypothetical protein
MAKRSPLRRYNPQRAANLVRRKQAEQCTLYHWTSEKDYGYFRSTGPFSDTEADSVMTWALNHPLLWCPQIVATFIDTAGDYYEELVTVPPIGPISLAKDAELLDDIIQQAVQEAEGSGNPQHHQDTLILLRLHSMALESRLEDETWLKEQAAQRAKTVRAKQLTHEIKLLESLLDEAV